MKRCLTLDECFQMEKGCNISIVYSKIGEINIGNNVFIGTKSVIFTVVEIADNVVGANSYVTSALGLNYVNML